MCVHACVRVCVCVCLCDTIEESNMIYMANVIEAYINRLNFNFKESNNGGFGYSTDLYYQLIFSIQERDTVWTAV